MGFAGCRFPQPGIFAALSPWRETRKEKPGLTHWAERETEIKGPPGPTGLYSSPGCLFSTPNNFPAFPEHSQSDTFMEASTGQTTCQQQCARCSKIIDVVCVCVPVVQQLFAEGVLCAWPSSRTQSMSKTPKSPASLTCMG